ncbi:hypothetical protein [Desulforhopalus singaporensis]|uniref:Lipoprotein n=1 Tax=Desulforhopalus singaporensis TaxID=91360 RepID=A0A1H0PT82_9BACT|nr:hypothetical protein [Desulforhopalus singaporensis]SDP08367.1 hypothetical protein SAMN05660330_01757 [Desulforhopalus singaporensis]
MSMLSGMKKICCYSAVLLLVGVTGGCMGLQQSNTMSTVPVSNDLGPVSNIVMSYGDIELPIEMQLVAKESMALRTDSFEEGIHVYRGRVEITSLKDYVISSMRQNKWKLVGEASYNNVMLAFTKPNKTCMVILSESVAALGKTQANFYVTVDVAAANRLNPFGEPVVQ